MRAFGTLRYFIGIGSNVDPERNVPLILDALLEIAPRLEVSRVVRTPPLGPIEGGDFLNLVVALDSALSPDEIRKRGQQIEVRLGRDRRHPDRKRLSREADIDPLFYLPEDARRVEASDLPSEPFLRPATLDLLSHLGLAYDAEPLPEPRGHRLVVAGRPFGERPTTLERPSG